MHTHIHTHDTQRVYRTTVLGKDAVVKERFAKGYRHPKLDKKLRTSRTLAVCALTFTTGGQRGN